MECSLRHSVYQVLMKLVHEVEKVSLGALSKEMCAGLLEDDKPSDCDPGCHSSTTCTARERDCCRKMQGYLKRPMYVRLADSLSEWLEKGVCPYLLLPSMYLLDEKLAEHERKSRIGRIDSYFQKLQPLWLLLSVDEQQERTSEVLLMLGSRGIMDMLGIRQTAGSVDMLPPSRTLLLKSFTDLHNEKAKLTAGARALAKHCHRDASLNWWGSSIGKEDAKNAHALSVVNRILNDASWINIHCLPHGVKIVEVRSIEGYGARWTADGSEFRGFLEPQMENGHTVGWQH